MKCRSRWAIYLLLAAFVVLSVRAAWMLTGSTLGWQPHLTQWTNAAGSFVGLESTPLSDKNPKDQAEFWLEQVNRIESANNDPQIALGAAWILDSPQYGYIKRHIRMKEGLNYSNIPPEMRRELDYDAIASLSEEFERLCRNECLSKIETAIQFDGDDVELWRARALLVFRSEIMRMDLKPRADDWLAVLDECSEHDPDNALYDYLAALQFWSSSADYDWGDDGYVLKLENRESFEQGIARFESGLGKSHLKFGTTSYAATLAFLDRTTLARLDHLTAAGSRVIDGRSSNVLYQLMRWQSVRQDAKLQAELFDTALADIRNVLRISDQVVEHGNSPNHSFPKLHLRQWALANLKELHENHPKLLSDDEARNVINEFADAQLALKVIEAAGKLLTDRTGTGTETHSPLAFSFSTAQLLVIVTLGVAFVSILVAWFFGTVNDEDRLAMGWFRHLVAWLGGFGVSFVLVGLCPAEVVSARVQTWLVYGLIWIGFAIPVLGMLFLIRSRFHVSWLQIAVLMVVTALPVLVAIHLDAARSLAVGVVASLHPIISIILIATAAALCWGMISILWGFARSEIQSRRRKCAVFGLMLSFAFITVAAGSALAYVMVDQIETRTWIPPTIWQEAANALIGAEELQSKLKMDDSKWIWAVIQWHAYDGFVVAPLIAVGILLSWHLIRRVRQLQGGMRELFRSRKRSQISLAGSMVARTCAVAALVFSLVYLAFTPTIAEIMEAHYRIQYQRMADPAKVWDEFRANIEEIKSDQETMEKLKAEIEERNRKIEEQKRSRQPRAGEIVDAGFFAEN